MADVLHAPDSPIVHAHYHAPIPRRSPVPADYFDSRSISPKTKTVSTPRAEHHEKTALWLIGSPTATPPDIDSAHIDSSHIITPTADALSMHPDLTLHKTAALPSYDGGPFYDHQAEFTCSEDSTESSVGDTTRSDSPLSTQSIVDDTSIRRQPSRQVDFLSHDWREEDIWSSWRNIVAQRKSLYGERSRLENASWRTWAKSKYRLRTVAPERLNWLKESDVTWLYGPLTTASTYPITKDLCMPSSQISKNNSFADLKPILKKRSMSEVMLQRSLSTSSLVRQATASIQAQGWDGPKQGHDSDLIDSKVTSEAPSRDQFDYLTSRSTSGDCTPSENCEKRHIRFDDRVEQCIAVECKYVEQDNDSDNDEAIASHTSDSSSDDGVVMMKQNRPAVKRSSSNKSSRSSSFDGRKTIETLPATTLKYRTDSPDVPDAAQHHTFGQSWTPGRLNHSSSQETLRPSSFHRDSACEIELDDETLDGDSSWSFEASNPKSSLASASRSRPGTHSPPRDGDFEYPGMRRTGSGMFMPYEEGEEDEAAASGFFGRVSDAINTARDIGHVIWTVGWGR